MRCAAALLLWVAVAIAPASAVGNACGSDGKGISNSDGTACCPASCGTCGGSGCGKRSIDSNSQCCGGDIQRSGVLCGVAPCVLSPQPAVSDAVKNCKNPEMLCGARWRVRGDPSAPVQLSPYTMCCTLFAEECRALRMLPSDGGAFRTACAPVAQSCPGFTSDCGSETYAFVPFGQTPKPECCKKGQECFADPKNLARNGTKCFAPKTCPKGQLACGRQKVPVFVTPDTKCCPAGQGCYIADKPNGLFTTSCGTCAVPCGRPNVNAKAGNDRCCLPRQKCINGFNGGAAPFTTVCKYPFGCASKPCKNGGVCREEGFPYAGRFSGCKCSSGFKGVFCEIKA